MRRSHAVRASVVARAQEDAQTDVAGGVDNLPEVRANLGSTVRTLRKERKLTVRALAASTGVTSGFISQLEHGRVMPSVATLVKLADVLDAHVGDLFNVRLPRTRIVRHDSRPRFEYPDLGVLDEIVSADPNEKLEVLLGYIKSSGGSGDELYTHGAESEFVMVLSGELELLLGDERHLLAKGDAITFSGDIPHGYVNRGSETVEVVWVMTPASY